MSSSFGKHRYLWTGLRSVETAQAFLVFLTGMQFLLVPKRAFSAAELPELAELLAKLPQRSRTRADGCIRWVFGC